ncbi:MAG: purine-binding chemotaxis protein CheW [Spirulina sp. SIO3F2]|nr:purine-binding chemotaxis protein CheW [Spirulina sp. SIO3F2]
MLLLLFRVGEDRYALDTQAIVEVIPRVSLVRYHGTPPTVAGRFNYQGQIVPVLDLSQLLGDKPCEPVWSTRIIVVNLAPSPAQPRLLGLLVEQATETLAGEGVKSAENRLQLSQQPYLGDVLLQDHEMIQCLKVEQILAEHHYDSLLSPLD